MVSYFGTGLSEIRLQVKNRKSETHREHTQIEREKRVFSNGLSNVEFQSILPDDREQRQKEGDLPKI